MKEMLSMISTDKAPKAIGPYSQAIEAYGSNGIIFISGQLPLTADGKMGKGVAEQTELAIKNIQAILESVGLSLNNVVKTTVFMTDLSKFDEMNKVYSRYFSKTLPARSTVEVKALPKGAEVEIEAVAIRSNNPNAVF